MQTMLRDPRISIDKYSDALAFVQLMVATSIIFTCSDRPEQVPENRLTRR
jgi:hypothetical protein